MGSCVSLNKGSESAVKLRRRPTDEKLVVTPSPPPVKEAVNGGDRTACSRDETFFDSQPWLESDCEDDYYSVNGDFITSRQSMPLHHGFASTQISKAAFLEQKVDSPPSYPSSPTDRKKRLSKLFQDSLRAADQLPVEEHNVAESNGDASNNMSPSKSTNAMRTNSAVSSERTDSVRTIVGDGYEDNSGQCCAPGLLRNRSLSGVRKKKAKSNVDHHSVG